VLHDRPVEEEVPAGPQCCGGTRAQTGHAIPHHPANATLGVSPKAPVRPLRNNSITLRDLAVMSDLGCNMNVGALGTDSMLYEHIAACNSWFLGPHSLRGSSQGSRAKRRDVSVRRTTNRRRRTEEED
jgi:hypothetical protein